jgi:cytochrome c-type biogenesis protein CcsB
MSLETWATISNQAFAAAAVVLALAWVAHLLEFAAGRNVPAPQREAVLAGGGASPRVDPVVEDSRLDESERAAMFGRVGVSLSVLGTLVLLVGVLGRGLAAERVPWGNMFEFATSGATAVMVVYLVLVRLYSVQWLGAVVTGFVVVVLGLSMLAYVDAGPLVPALHSYWLVLHVAAAMIAGAGFIVGAGASLFYLLKSRAERTTDPDTRTGYLWRLPSSAAMDRLAYRVHAFAFPVWTFAALIAGPIWAEYAWGRYWGWDPKEVWAFITWVVYAGYLHARATAGWRGKGAAVLALIGFATFIFNFVGINLFASGLHSYSF